MISVVSFHHKMGPIVEYAYPENYIDNLTIEKEKLEEKLTLYGMPDAIHNKNEDCMYFNITLEDKKNEKFLVYGVAYFK